jgi:hypothetical protein
MDTNMVGKTPEFDSGYDHGFDCGFDEGFNRGFVQGYEEAVGGVECNENEFQP